MLVLILFSVLSGLVTVLSPCILPVLPVVLSSSVAGGKARPLGVIAGLIISFSIFTLAVAKIVSLLGLSANVLRLAAVLLIATLGLSMLIPAFNRFVEIMLGRLPGLVKSGPNGSGFGPGFLTGASLGLIWAPCAGPILAAVTTLAATQSVSFGALWVLVSYAIGVGLPLLIIAYGGRTLIKRTPILTRNLGRIQQIFGAIMLLTAVLIALNVDTLVTAWVTEMVPADWTTSLNAFESSPVVNTQLNQLKEEAQMPTASLPNSIPLPAEAPIPETATIDLPVMGAAPDFSGIDHWINSQPLTLAGLRGKVVLVDFWTFSCINCIHTLPYVTGWYNKYHDQGFVVVGVHSPEFDFEHDTSNVEDAVKRFKIYYPVAQDNAFSTWNAYQNQYWPAEYFIDANGNLRYTHFGEGSYAESETIIQKLLQEAGKPVSKQ